MLMGWSWSSTPWEFNSQTVFMGGDQDETIAQFGVAQFFFSLSVFSSVVRQTVNYFESLFIICMYANVSISLNVEDEGACVETVTIYDVVRSKAVLVDEGRDYIKAEPISRGHFSAYTFTSASSKKNFRVPVLLADPSCTAYFSAWPSQLPSSHPQKYFASDDTVTCSRSSAFPAESFS